MNRCCWCETQGQTLENCEVSPLCLGALGRPSTGGATVAEAANRASATAAEGPLGCGSGPTGFVAGVSIEQIEVLHLPHDVSQLFSAFLRVPSICFRIDFSLINCESASFCNCSSSGSKQRPCGFSPALSFSRIQLLNLSGNMLWFPIGYVVRQWRFP